jgi:hypothetical protein
MTTRMHAEPEALASRADADALCARLSATTLDLLSLLERETEMLRRAQAQEIAGLVTHKTMLSTQLARDTQVLRDNLAFLRASAPEKLESLREEHRAFSRALDVNGQALAAMKSVSEQLLKAIARQAEEGRAGPDTYGKGAAYAASRAGRPAAISVNRSL